MSIGSFPSPNGVSAAVPNPGGGFFFSTGTTGNISITASALTPTPLPPTGLLLLIGMAAIGAMLAGRQRVA
jgi:hypothetical protein